MVAACVLQLLSSAGAILLQREIPEEVNIEVAKVRASWSCTSGINTAYE